MSPTAPEWLTRRAGSLKRANDGDAWYVIFDEQPHYRLGAVPAKGKYGCLIVQTENGRLLDFPGIHDTPEAALQAAVDHLGKSLGWA